MATPTHLGMMVRAHRRQARLSQEGLAERADISVRTLRDIESGRVREPRPATVQLIVAALALDGPDRAALFAGDPPAAGPVAQLPAAVPDFTGRGGLVTDLTQRLTRAAAEDRGARVVVVLSGPAGVGKTALAVHLAHRLRDQFPGGQLFAELRGAHAPTDRPGHRPGHVPAQPRGGRARRRRPRRAGRLAAQPPLRAPDAAAPR